jgi:hypothetical protein
LFGGAGEGEAEFAELIDVHFRRQSKSVLNSSLEILRASSSDARRMTSARSWQHPKKPAAKS